MSRKILQFLDKYFGLLYASEHAHTTDDNRQNLTLPSLRLCVDGAQRRPATALPPLQEYAVA
jgi:hypothetical protein